jgi:hypothetical protein
MNRVDARSVVQVEELRIDRGRFEVMIGGREVKLTRKEFELIWAVATDRGKAFHSLRIIYPPVVGASCWRAILLWKERNRCPPQAKGGRDALRGKNVTHL